MSYSSLRKEYTTHDMDLLIHDMDVKQAKELRIKLALLNFTCTNVAKLTTYIYPSSYSPVGTLNSIPDLFNDDEECVAPKLDEEIILTKLEREDGFHLTSFKLDNENKILIRVFCNIEDIAVKLQLNNFYKFINNHPILNKLFDGNILSNIFIGRYSATLRQLQAEIEVSPYLVRLRLESLAYQCAKDVKELEQEAYVYRNREMLDVVDEEDFDECDNNNENNDENNNENNEEVNNENDNEEEGNDEEDDDEIKEPPTKKIQLTITVNEEQLIRIDEKQKKTLIEKLNEEEDQLRLKRNILEKIIFSLTDDDILEMDIHQNKENEEAEQDDDEDDDN